jgi:hypothetical protein
MIGWVEVEAESFERASEQARTIDVGRFEVDGTTASVCFDTTPAVEVAE